MVGSLDVKALYPSLNQEQSAEIIAQFVNESPIDIQGIDWRATQVFIAINMTEKEIKREEIQKLVPERKYKMGKRPGATTDELREKTKGKTIDRGGETEEEKIPKQQSEEQGGKKGNNNKDKEKKNEGSKWKDTDPEKDLSEEHKRKLLSIVVKIAIINIFANHVYQFGGRIYKQILGGPIGLRLTSMIARIVIDAWSKQFLKKLLEVGFNIHAFMKYVDYVNIIIGKKDRRLKWGEDGKLVREQEGPVDSKIEETTDEATTMKLIREAADSIIPWLKFTTDLPEDHASKKVPMLDLQVWIIPEEERSIGREMKGDLLCWKFYEKPTTQDTRYKMYI